MGEREAQPRAIDTKRKTMVLARYDTRQSPLLECMLNYSISLFRVTKWRHVLCQSPFQN